MILLFSDSRMGALPAEQIPDLLVFRGFGSSEFFCKGQASGGGKFSCNK